MTRLLLDLPLAAAAFAPADAARGEGPAAVAEIVTFRLARGVTEPAFLDAARATGALLDAAPGFVARRLSKGADGRWTDHVIWTDMPRAEAAAAHVMSDPAAAPFLAAIDPASVEMRHEVLLWTLEAR
jgi:hypothetical protein